MATATKGRPKAAATQAAKTRTIATKKAAPPPEPEPLEVEDEDDGFAPTAEYVDGVLTIDDPEEAQEGLRDGIPLRLVGVDYSVRPPKMAMSLRLGKISRAAAKEKDVGKVLSVLNEWVLAAMGKKQAAAVMKRLEDAEDRLDYDHIMRLIEAVVEYQHGGQGNPPT